MDYYKEVKKELLKHFKFIFGGDVVEQVFVVVYNSDNFPCSQKEIRDELRHAERNLYPEKRMPNRILCEGQIVIKFTSGDYVEFQNSEWGHMEKISLDKYQSI